MTGYHNVRPYRRRDGTYVRGHVRRNPTRSISVSGVILLIVLVAWLSALAHSHAQGTGRTNSPNVQHSRVAMVKP